jgi:hypothetical protein
VSAKKDKQLPLPSSKGGKDNGLMEKTPGNFMGAA